jgi:hypothetical protein
MRWVEVVVTSRRCAAGASRDEAARLGARACGSTREKREGPRASAGPRPPLALGFPRRGCAASQARAWARSCGGQSRRQRAVCEERSEGGAAAARGERRRAKGPCARRTGVQIWRRGGRRVGGRAEEGSGSGVGGAAAESLPSGEMRRNEVREESRDGGAQRRTAGCSAHACRRGAQPQPQRREARAAQAVRCGAAGMRRAWLLVLCWCCWCCCRPPPTPHRERLKAPRRGHRARTSAPAARCLCAAPTRHQQQPARSARRHAASGGIKARP